MIDPGISKENVFSYARTSLYSSLKYDDLKTFTLQYYYTLTVPK
jgi:hypothetical protein